MNSTVIRADRHTRGESIRIFPQIGKCYLFHPSSGMYMCPLSMTDGAATTISASGMKPGGTDLSTAFAKLTSRNPSEFWTSGQWMTERGGRLRLGSDVG